MVNEYLNWGKKIEVSIIYLRRKTEAFKFEKV